MPPRNSHQSTPVLSTLTVVLACAALAAFPLFARAGTAGGYVIITTTNIVAQSTNLAAFIASREACGYDVTVVSNTATAQGGWGGGSGDAAAENIRSWLQANYTNEASEPVIDYVLLIGNPNPTNGTVPMKACYPESTNALVPTDLYYCELTGNWDKDGDGYCGEWSETSTNSAHDLRCHEVLVGRIPNYGCVSHCDSILAKVMTYESSSREDAGWRDCALLAMNDDIGDYISEWSIGEWIKDNVLIPAGWSYHRVYDVGSASPETTPCHETQVMQVWTGGTFGAVFWWSHGLATHTHASNGGPDDNIIGIDEVPDLDDTTPVFAFQGSCLNAHPETTNNLAYSLLLNGAISTVAATRPATSTKAAYPWAHPDTQSCFELRYAEKLIRHKLGAADALMSHKMDNPPRDASYWLNYLIHNVYGTPDGHLRAVRFAGPRWAL